MDGQVEVASHEESLKKSIDELGMGNAIIKHLGEAGMTKMLYHVLFGEKEAENYVIIPAVAENTESDFEIILHKRKKKLPTQATLDILWAKIDGNRKEEGDLLV